MAKLPDPSSSAALAKIPPARKTLTRGTLLWRIYFQRGRFPTTWEAMRFFGPTNNRFDHHQPPPGRKRRGILYAAIDGATCFAEAFQETRVIDTRRHAPWLVGFRLVRRVTLLDLSGTWPTRAGASMAINSGPRSRARRWSRAIHAAYRGVDGLWYCSSMNANKHAVALYERARSAVPGSPAFHRALADPALARTVQYAGAEFGYLVV